MSKRGVCITDARALKSLANKVWGIRPPQLEFPANRNDFRSSIPYGPREGNTRELFPIRGALGNERAKIPWGWGRACPGISSKRLVTARIPNLLPKGHSMTLPNLISPGLTTAAGACAKWAFPRHTFRELLTTMSKVPQNHFNKTPL